jgi:DNA invertase Pin-like site-specific DNA recombinase
MRSASTHANAAGRSLLDDVDEFEPVPGEEFSYEHRPVLLSLIERAEQGEYDVLLVARLDRLSRDYPTLAVLERRLQRFGVEVVSTAEENGDGAMAEFIRGQVALVAQLERAMIRDRLSAGKANAKQAGRHVHGRIPYGYRSHRGVLEPDEERAAIVRRIFRDAADGYTPGWIARRLERDGVPTPRGGAKGWSQMSVRTILTNSAYTGERHDVKKAHPAIVSRQLFNRAQAVLDSRRRAG